MWFCWFVWINVEMKVVVGYDNWEWVCCSVIKLFWDIVFYMMKVVVVDENFVIGFCEMEDYW